MWSKGRRDMPQSVGRALGSGDVTSGRQRANGLLGVRVSRYGGRISPVVGGEAGSILMTAGSVSMVAGSYGPGSHGQLAPGDYGPGSYGPGSYAGTQLGMVQAAIVQAAQVRSACPTGARASISGACFKNGVYAIQSGGQPGTLWSRYLCSVKILLRFCTQRGPDMRAVVQV